MRQVVTDDSTLPKKGSAMRRTKLCAVALVASLGVVGSAHAANVLVFGDRVGDRNNLSAELTAQGHIVTNVALLPADLTPFDTIWHVGAFVALTGAEQAQLSAFLALGRGIHFTGERPCCDVMNASIQTLVNSVLAGGGVTVGSQGDIPGPYSFNPTAAGGVTTTPNTLTGWNPSGPGGMAGVSGANVLVTGSGGNTVGAVWGPSDMVNGSGCLTILMDVNWFSIGPPKSDPAIVENIQAFLECTVDTDGDGVLDDVDVCPDTMIPEGVPTRSLGVNRWALVDGDGIFDTTPPPGGGDGPPVGFIIDDTGGCSCEQIIVALGLGKGHVKYGCSISAMQEWVALVNPSQSSGAQLLVRGTAPNDPVADRAERKALRREARRQARLERRLQRRLERRM